ncbi:MAG: hypothetical protein AMXMBFR59_32640 [Rhodanobacteraceae bacterium]
MRRVLGSLLILVATTAMATAAEPASRLAVEGTEFMLYRADGRVLRSAELIGAELDIGGGRQLRIDAVRPDPADANGHILLHRFSQRVGDGGWADACGADREGRREGFPVPGRWVDGRYRHEATHFALTCTGGAQAKCVRWGYRPWDRAADGSALADLYEACVHMVRADYCGDGTATTRDGMVIDIYDPHGVQKPESGADFRFEAGWAPTGAVCVNHVRVPENVTLDTLAARCPRLAPVLGNRCDEATARAAGAVLFNRSR